MSAPTADHEAPLYAFEKQHGRAGHREPREARAQLTVLWERIGGDPQDLPALEQDDPDGWQFLMRYVTDGPLNIKWYDEKRPQLENKQRRYNVIVLIVVSVLFLLAMAMPFQPLLMAMMSPSIDLDRAGEVTGLVDVAALLGVVGTGATVVLRMSAQVVRYRRQAAVFHKAGSALKEQLYRLEGDWVGRPLLDPEAEGTRLHPDFSAAIRQAVGLAQGILADERDEYFDTLIVDVNALTDNTARAADHLATQPVMRSDRRHEHEKGRMELVAKISEALLDVQTSRGKIEVLEEELAAAPDDMKVDLTIMIREEKLIQRAAEQRLAHLQAELKAKYGG